MIDYLERTVLPGLSECIVDDFYVTPKHFEENLNTLHGTGFSIQPIFSQSAVVPLPQQSARHRRLVLRRRRRAPGRGDAGRAV
ncbi:MAG: hypothetical protein QM754_11280 [Tepidisphaeraceae bacterium]